MTAVLISVVMPVYDTGRYLVEAVESVLAQEVPGDAAFELLIVDDRSTDAATLAILQGYAGSDARIRVIRNEGRKGVSGARNLGIREAKGDWIGFMDSDDYYLPGALAAHYALIRSAPDAEWIGGLFFLMRGSEIDRTDLAQRSPNLYSVIGDDYRANRPTRLVRPVDVFARNCILAPPSVLVRRALLLRKGLFDEDLKRAEDYHLWFKCAVDTDLWMIPQVVYIHRFREGSLTTGDEPLFFHEHLVLDRLLEDPDFRPHRPALLRRLDLVMDDYCHFFRAAGDHSAALHWAVHWLKRRPFEAAAWKQLAASALRR